MIQITSQLNKYRFHMGSTMGRNNRVKHQQQGGFVVVVVLCLMTDNSTNCRPLLVQTSHRIKSWPSCGTVWVPRAKVRTCAAFCRGKITQLVLLSRSNINSPATLLRRLSRRAASGSTTSTWIPHFLNLRVKLAPRRQTAPAEFDWQCFLTAAPQVSVGFSTSH